MYMNMYICIHTHIYVARLSTFAAHPAHYDVLTLTAVLASAAIERRIWRRSG